MQKSTKSITTPDFSEEYREAQEALDKRIPLGVKLGIVAVLIIMLFASFALGKYPVAPDELVKNIVAQITVGVYNLFNDPDIVISDAANTALFNIRLPRIVVVMLVGAALSVAGAAYQGMFKTPSPPPTSSAHPPVQASVPAWRFCSTCRTTWCRSSRSRAAWWPWRAPCGSTAWSAPTPS